MTELLSVNPKTVLKRKMKDFTNKLEEWTAVLAKSPDSQEAKNRIAIYKKLIAQIKSNLKYVGRRHKKIAAKAKKWSPVLSGSFENGKRR